MTRARVLLSVSWLASAGCEVLDCPTGGVPGQPACAPPAVLACRNQQPSVSSGVFGCVTATDDVGTPRPPEALPMFGVQVFIDPPPSTPDDGLEPAAATRSDATGFYELPLPPGRYWLCTTFRRCTPIDTTATVPLRRDYDFGPGPGW
jgi:hypothetical protein